MNARRRIERAPEAEAERIASAPDPEVRDYMHRGMMGRWLSTRRAMPQLDGAPAPNEGAGGSRTAPARLSNRAMMQSAEIRWFWSGQPPADFAKWFLTGMAAAPGESRQDEYLATPNQMDLGIKRRSGRDVEIKGLIARKPEVLRFASLECPVEIWSKWPCQTLDLEGNRLLKVGKHRCTRSFETVRETAHAHDGEEPPACTIELTNIIAPDLSPWWTLGFEAHGVLTGIEATLRAVVDTMASCSPPPLGDARAQSYPAWLARFCRIQE